MSRVLIICCAALSVAAPSAARQSAAPQASSEQTASAPDSAAAAASAQLLRDQKQQLFNFEIFLHGALRTAVQKFGQWVQQVAPSVYVTQAVSPAVHGFPLTDGDLVFTVQQAELLGSQVLTLQLQQPGRRPGIGPDGRPLPAPGTVVSQGGGLVAADPMGPGIAPDPQPKEGCARVTLGPINPDLKYAECVKEALINAMLDNSVMLPLKPGQSLTIVDIPIDAAVQNQVYSNQSKKLILSIKAEDLTAFHQGKITRDEAKLKISEQRF